ncbi:hypothetical protein U1Q18_036596, partial [Sarracenia purpurea var. burkii]
VTLTSTSTSSDVICVTVGESSACWSFTCLLALRTSFEGSITPFAFAFRCNESARRRMISTTTRNQKTKIDDENQTEPPAARVIAVAGEATEE